MIRIGVLDERYDYMTLHECWVPRFITGTGGGRGLCSDRNQQREDEFHLIDSGKKHCGDNARREGGSAGGVPRVSLGLAASISCFVTGTGMKKRGWEGEIGGERSEKITQQVKRWHFESATPADSERCLTWMLPDGVDIVLIVNQHRRGAGRSGA